MRATIIILAVFALLLIYLGKMQGRSGSNPDDYGWIVPEIVGYAILGTDLVVLIGYALWRLFK